jgi:hypothetical protein
MAYGGLTEENKSTQDILDEMQGQAEGAQFSTPKQTKVDGMDGLLVEFSGEEAGQKLQGKMVVAAPFPEQEFYITALAPEARWKELEPVFDAVLKSVTFFEAQPFDFGFEDGEWDEPDDDDWEAIVEEPLPYESPYLGDVSAAPQVAPGQVIRQWAVRAEASSEYTADDWSAMQATGAPDVPACGDDHRAWASAEPDSEDYLVLHYETPVNPTELVIYQTYNPSQVVEIQLVNTAGETWMVWNGEPEAITHCPDVWTHTITPDEPFYADTVVIWVDQSVLGLGWVEIDAVELVGYPQGVSGMPSGPQPGGAPSNFTGLMAGPVYQAWLDIKVGETMESELARIMPIAMVKHEDAWKPNPDHKQTYVVDMPWTGMKGFIAVHNEGWVYKKYFNEVDPTDFFLTTVSRDNYWEFVNPRVYETNVPYVDVANHFESPGFLRDETYLGGKRSEIYWWYGANGELVVGLFTDGVLSTLSDLVFYDAP